jgi:hypothetical protein
MNPPFYCWRHFYWRRECPRCQKERAARANDRRLRMTRRLLAAAVLTAALLGQAALADAYCHTHTIWAGPKMIVCSTCCYYGNCTTTCF